MNVYDFDNTIFEGDSTMRFVLFCLKSRPKTWLYIPRIAFSALRFYTFRIGTKTQFKERMYSFLKVCDTENDVKRFWRKNIVRIKPFYKDIHKPDDVIISASPEFLLKPLESKLDIRVIASRVSPADGKTTGENCYYEEKVKRFYEAFPGGCVDDFYSDSYSDEPMAKLSNKAFIVNGDDIIPWDFSKHKNNLRI